MAHEVKKFLNNAVVTLSKLKPFEVDMTAGLSPDMQRLWRRRGFLDRTHASRASFDVAEVAAISIAVCLTRRGYSPNAGMEVGRSYRSRVLQLAILEVDGAVEVIGGTSSVRQFVDLMCGDLGYDISAQLAGVVGDEDTMMLVSIDGAPFEGTSHPPDFDRLNGEIDIVLISLVGAGLRLGNRLGRPLVRVEFPLEDGEETQTVRKVLEARSHRNVALNK